MKTQVFIQVCTALILFSGCSTRKFVISSVPEGAYIVGYGETRTDKPVDGSVTFLGKSDEHRFVAMKRGYTPDTLTVTKESPLDLQFDLKPIKGTSTQFREAVELDTNNVHLLPVCVEILLHKGAGNLDRYEHSEELSAEAFLALNNELQKIQSDSTVSYLSISEGPEWNAIAEELKESLLVLDPALLKYYPEAPSVSSILGKNPALFDPIRDRLKQSGDKEYLAFAWTRSIKPSAGRIIGNMGLAVASGVVAGYETAAYGYPVTLSDPSAFLLDNSTLFAVYLIDPSDAEVLDIRQYVLPYDITKEERVQSFARSVILFPLAESDL